MARKNRCVRFKKTHRTSHLEACGKHDSTGDIVDGQRQLCDGVVGLVMFHATVANRRTHVIFTDCTPVSRGFPTPGHARASGARNVDDRCNPFRVLSCPAMSWHVIPCDARVWHVVLGLHVLSCPVLSWHQHIRFHAVSFLHRSSCVNRHRSEP